MPHLFLTRAEAFSRALFVQYGANASPIASIFAENAKKGDFVETLGSGV
jgi:hypothetical protein